MIECGVGVCMGYEPLDYMDGGDVGNRKGIGGQGIGGILGRTNKARNFIL